MSPSSSSAAACRRRRRPARRRAAPSAGCRASARSWSSICLAASLRAGARQPLHAVEHAAQILRAQLAHRVAVERPRHLRVLAQLLGQRLHELVERRAKLVHQLLDLFVGGAALQRLAQRILRRAKLLLGLGDVAVLEHHRHRPQPRHHVAQRVVVLGARELPVDRAQPEIDVGLRDEPLRRDRQRIERHQHMVLGVGVEREIAALLDQRARQRLGERPLRQPHLLRRRAAFVVALVAGDQRHRHVDAGPRMLGQILGGRAGAVAGARLRQHQREVRRVVTAGAAPCRRLAATRPCARTSPARRPRRSRPRSCS